jgi:hypothetical protein
MSEFNPAEADQNNEKFSLDGDVNVAEAQPHFRGARQASAPEYQETTGDYDTEIHGEFDNDAYDASIGFNAIENVAPEPDDAYPRYGLSGLLPINLMKQNGNNSWADFNKKLLGRTIVNFNYYPAFTIIPIFGGSFDIPFECLPTHASEPIKPAPFDFDSFMQQPQQGISKVDRTAKQCADIFLMENRSSGGGVLYSLVGYHVRDTDKGFAAARKLVETILPYRDRTIFPVSERVKAGVVFKGPFLDELLDNLKAEGISRLRAAGYDTSPDSPEMKCYAEIRHILSNGEKRAHAFLDETEAEIKKPDGLKRAYDPPDLETYDAPVSTDLYCLAQTNRIEADMRQLRASENIGTSLADPMTKPSRK